MPEEANSLSLWPMPYYDFGQQRDHEPYEDGGALLRALWELYDAGIRPGFQQLLKENLALAAHNFGVWLFFPLEIVDDQPAIQRYSTMVTDMASILARSGYQEPVQLLAGLSENPMTRWEHAFHAYEDAVKRYEFGEAAEFLQETLEEMRGFGGPGVEMRRPYAHERLSWVYFITGDLESAELNAHAAWREFKALEYTEGLVGITRRLADVARQKQDTGAFKRWMTIHTNYLIQIGHAEHAASVRRLNGIEPEEGHINIS